MNKRVLIVDDSGYMRSKIQEVLTNEGFEVAGTAPNGETAIDMALELKPDFITLDNILPDMTGLDVLKTIKEQGLESVVIIISAVGQQSTINEGLELGASEYITKPFSEEHLIRSIRKVLD